MRLLALAACVCALWTQAALAVVFGEDQRRAPSAEERAADSYGFVGRLVCRSAWINLHHATGVLVDIPGHPQFAGVLTVAHALRNGRRDADYTGCRYRARGKGWWGGARLLARASGDFDESYARNEHDWAVALVAAADVVGVPRARPVADSVAMQRAVDGGASLALIGFPDDRSGIAVAQSCRARAPQPGELLHGQRMWLSDCDQVEGASGAALVTRTAEGDMVLFGLYRGPVFATSEFGRRPPDHVDAFDPQRIANAIVPISAQMLDALQTLAVQAASRSADTDADPQR